MSDFGVIKCSSCGAYVSPCLDTEDDLICSLCKTKLPLRDLEEDEVIPE